MHPFGTGAEYKEDPRDYAYVATGGVPETLPISYKTDTSMFPVLMQNKTPACVSHMWARLLQVYFYKKTGKVINFSPRFLHAMSANGASPEVGRDPRVVGDVLTDFGCCTEATLPNDTTLDNATYQNVVITQAMLDEANQYKIPAYRFPTTDQYSIRHAIYHKGAVGLMFVIGDEWWTPTWLTKDINPLRPPKVVVSGHEVTGEHWGTLDGFENSWSTAWNESGYGEYDISNYQPVQIICIDDPEVDFNPTNFKFLKDLSYGDQNEDVRQLQKRLNLPLQYQTSFFGAITRGAVIKYQLANGIFPPFGYVGLKTRTKLNST